MENLPFTYHVWGYDGTQFGSFFDKEAAIAVAKTISPEKHQTYVFIDEAHCIWSNFPPDTQAE